MTDTEMLGELPLECLNLWPEDVPPRRHHGLEPPRDRREERRQLDLAVEQGDRHGR
jgi:hypothetical protein